MLRVLRCDDNELSELSHDDIGRTSPRLEHIDCSRNRIGPKLPKTLGELDSLRALHADFNEV